MTYKGYQSKVELDEEAGVFHGEAINTRDAITFQGTSVEGLKQAFEDSVDDYLEFCASRGEDPEKASSCPGETPAQDGSRGPTLGSTRRSRIKRISRR
jgi:predicted HicB family RNase H-like nuclease